MRNRWIRKHKIDTKVSENCIDETGSSERNVIADKVFASGRL